MSQKIALLRGSGPVSRLSPGPPTKAGWNEQLGRTKSTTIQSQAIDQPTFNVRDSRMEEFLRFCRLISATVRGRHVARTIGRGDYRLALPHLKVLRLPRTDTVDQPD